MTLSCCGQKLTELSECNSEVVENNGNIVDNAKDIDKNDIKVEYIEDDIFVTVDHPMIKEHFISFMAYVTVDKLMINKLYPEQDVCSRFKRSGHGIIYVLCNKHGLVSKRI